MNLNLQEKVNKSQCSHFAKNEMVEAIRLVMCGKGTTIPETVKFADK